MSVREARQLASRLVQVSLLQTSHPIFWNPVAGRGWLQMKLRRELASMREQLFQKLVLAVDACDPRVSSRKRY